MRMKEMREKRLQNRSKGHNRMMKSNTHRNNLKRKITPKRQLLKNL
jgi:hypothetical protein